jgi:hypothetical protein
MLVRRSVPLLLAGVLAAAGCKDVNQRDPAPVLVLATFDPTTGIIPLPNDLALQGAVGLPDGPQRDALFTLIGLGGWPPPTSMWSPVQGIAIPIRTEVFNDDQGFYEPGPPPADIDIATVRWAADDPASTVAIVRLNEPATEVALATPPVFFGGALILNPEGGAFLPGRYVVAVRGGRNGVMALVDGEPVPLEADRPIALVAPNKDLSVEENQPPGGLDATQVAALERLRGTFAVAMDWNAVDVPPEPAPDPCLLVLGVSPPEGVCWLPPVPQLGGTLPTPGFVSAFAGVDMVFPHEEIASIQTFEVFTPPMPELQDEVTP